MSAQSRIRRSLRRTGPRRVVAALAALALSAPATPALAGESAEASTTTAVATPAVPLPFDLPSTSVLRGAPKKAFAHYVPWFPVSHDNKSPDYYDRNFLTVDGEGGKHAAYGGYLRDRPAPRPVLADSAYKLRDLETEVRQAAAAGLDGFSVDILQLGDTGGTQWTAVQQLLQAARNVDPGFKIMLMPDMTGSAMQLKTPQVLAKYMAQLGSSPAAYRLADGRLVVSPFTAERKTVAFWTEFLAVMKTTYGMPVAFLPLFQNEQTQRDAFDPISWGMSNWGNRTPAWNNPTTTTSTSPMGRIAAVHALGQKWMQPVSVQDQRPHTGIYDEAENTQNLRNTWQIARASGAALVHLPTWNDYAEGTSFAPSKRNGWTYLDLNAYYLTWYKTGTAPTIARDAVYLTHRIAPHAALPTYAQTKLMKWRGGSPARDTVEALTFLTAPATVKVTVGTTTTSCAAPAGVSTCTVPLRTGAVSATVVRGGVDVTEVVSPEQVVARPYVQDMQYVASSSGRQVRRPDTTAPSVPGTPSATAGDGAVSLAWGASTDDRGVVQYEVHRSATSGFTPSDATRIASTTSTSSTQPTALGTWHYRVVARDAAGNASAASATASATVLDTTAPSAPTAPVATVSGTTVDLSWQAATDDVGVTAYEVHRSTSPAFAPSSSTLLTTTTATTSTSTAPVGTWYHRVVARDDAGNTGAASATASATVLDTTAPSAPTAPVATVSGTTVDLSWQAATDDVGVTTYDVHRSTSPAFVPSSSTLLTTTTATTSTSSATVGTWYHRVVARDAAGNTGAASAEVAATVAPVPTVITVRPSADTYANEGAPSTNYGRSSSLTSRGSLGATSYLSLAVPATPAGKTLRSAVLRIRTTSESMAGSTATHAVRLVAGSWTETGTTWSSRPALSSTLLGTVDAGTVPNAVYTAELDTAAVASLAGTVRSLAVTSTGTDNLWFWSANHANEGYRPQLVLTYS